MAPSRVRSELPLILASLFIAAVIWLIAKQADLERDWLSAAVEVRNVPPFMTIEAPSRVSINVQYPKELSNQNLEKGFVIPINAEDIFNLKPGQWIPPRAAKEVVYELKPSSVKSGGDPKIRVVAVDPQAIKLIGRLRTQTLKVKVETTGTLPNNLMFTGPPKAEPEQLLATGSPDLLSRLAASSNTVATEPIDLSALQGSCQVYPQVRLPEGAILLGRADNDRRIAVNIGLTERPERLTLRGVPVGIVTFSASLKPKFIPAGLDVVLEGPGSAIRSIVANDIAFAPARELNEQTGHSYEVGLEARLKNTVPAETARQVRIVELRPSRITVEFVPVDAQNKTEGAPREAK